VGSRDIPDNEFRVLLARRGQHWVSAVRVGDEITVDERRDRRHDLDRDPDLRCAGVHPPCRAGCDQRVNVPLDEMLEVTKAWQSSGFNVFSGGRPATAGDSARRLSPRSARRCRTRAQRRRLCPAIPG